METTVDNQPGLDVQSQNRIVKPESLASYG